MMPATEKEFIRDYIERTKLNYERLKAGPYEVTQLINSAIGLLIIPEQKLYDKITNKMISKKLLNELIRSVYKALHADHETGAADNKTG